MTKTIKICDRCGVQYEATSRTDPPGEIFAGFNVMDLKVSVVDQRKERITMDLCPPCAKDLLIWMERLKGRVKT